MLAEMSSREYFVADVTEFDDFVVAVYEYFEYQADASTVVLSIIL